MTLLTPAPVDIRQFTYNAARRRFTGDISETHGFGQVWDDAADVGLTIVNPQTGRSQVFVVVGEDRDADGDVRFWTLHAVDGKNVGGYTMTLFND